MCRNIIPYYSNANPNNSYRVGLLQEGVLDIEFTALSSTATLAIGGDTLQAIDINGSTPEVAVSLSKLIFIQYPVMQQINSLLYSYRFGFNGQERELGINQSVTAAEYWFYDGRLGRRWNVDPVTGSYPWQSPYAAFNNNPIYFADPLGLQGEGTTQYSTPGSSVYLPNSATDIELYDQRSSAADYYSMGADGLKHTKEGLVMPMNMRSFSMNGVKYSATWNTDNPDQFLGYTNASGEYYNFGETGVSNFNPLDNNYLNRGLSVASMSVGLNSYMRMKYYFGDIKVFKDLYNEGRLSAQGGSMARYFVLKNTRSRLDFFGAKFSDWKKPLPEAKAQVEKFLSTSNPTQKQINSVFKSNKWVTGFTRFGKYAGPVATVGLEAYNYNKIVTTQPTFEEVKDMYSSPFSNPLLYIYQKARIEYYMLKWCGAPQEELDAYYGK